MAEPVSVGIWAARKSAVTGGDRVLITGAGPIGLLAGQVARALGADTPVITDVSDFRLARARDLACGPRRLELRSRRSLTCSWNAPAPAALTGGMRALAPAGRVALVGMGADTVTLDVALVQERELSVTGVFRYANTYPLALQLISSGAVNVTDVITHRFPLEDTERALTINQTDRSSLKAMVHTADRTQAGVTA